MGEVQDAQCKEWQGVENGEKADIYSDCRKMWLQGPGLELSSSPTQHCHLELTHLMLLWRDVWI